MDESLIQDPIYVLVVLVGVLALLFGIQGHAKFGKLFRVIPLLIFAYFVPTTLSNTGLIPLKSPLYDFTTQWLLPTSLLLLTLSVDIPAILRLGPRLLALFLIATGSIVIGGPLAYLALGSFVPPEFGDQAWKGLAALSGSWIGGGANFTAIGESVGTDSSTLSMIVVVDVAVANVWMAFLLFFASREREMDEKIGADRRAVDEVRERVEAYQAGIAKPTSLPALSTIVFLGFGGTALATAFSEPLATALVERVPGLADVVNAFTVKVLVVTAIGVAFSFTRVRRLEGVGASAVGSLFLYVLVATIGAKAEFSRLLDAPVMLAIGAIWMIVHVSILMLARRLLKAPIFFAAVGSKANVGGAASAPIVAHAFHPALAPVGVLLAVAGYALGTPAGVLCAYLLKVVDGIVR